MELNKKEVEKLQQDLVAIQTQIETTEKTLKQIDSLLGQKGGSKRRSSNKSVKKLKEQKRKLYNNLQKIAIKLYRYL
jgi:hypothetical protein